MNKTNYDGALPRYAQIKRWIEQQIGVGRWQPGDTLPPEKELATLLQVSPLTVSRALQWLAREGVVVRKRRYGTVIAAHLPSHLTEQEANLLITVAGGGARYEFDFYVGALHRGIQSRLPSPAFPVRWLDYDKQTIQRAIDQSSHTGILAITPDPHDIPWLTSLYRKGAPVVVLGASGDENWELPFVDSDNEGGARQAIQWLVEAGHERFIGLFAYPHMYNTQDRWRGFREALRDAQVPEENVWTFCATGLDNFEEPIRDTIRTLLKMPNPPTALVAGGFYLALIALQIAYEMERRVPDDLSVIGFDDPPSAALSVPALTTLRQPLEEMGAQAVDILLSLLRGQTNIQKQVRLPLELVHRNSATIPARLNNND